MIKKIVIWLFSLNDLKALYIAERQRQKHIDEKELNRKMNCLDDIHEMEIARIRQSYEAELEIQGQELATYKRRDRELTEKEYTWKTQRKNNTSTAAYLYQHIFDIANGLQKSAAEIKGILDKAKDNAQKQISDR